MPDFHQIVVPTFTRFVDQDLASREKGILRAARRAPGLKPETTQTGIAFVRS